MKIKKKRKKIRKTRYWEFTKPFTEQILVSEVLKLIRDDVEFIKKDANLQLINEKLYISSNYCFSDEMIKFKVRGEFIPIPKKLHTHTHQGK